jgi:ribosomal protein L24E
MDRTSTTLILFAAAVCAVSCGREAPSANAVKKPDSISESDPSPTTTISDTSIQGEAPTSKSPRRRSVAPVEIGGSAVETTAKLTAQNSESVRAALKPFQVLLGKWRGLSKKANSEESEWAYDWVTDPQKPGLKITSVKGIYIREGRLSYRSDEDLFEFKTTDGSGQQHVYTGSLIEPVRDVPSDDKKPQRTYKLQLTESGSSSDGDWRVTFNQQDNNRIIVEVDRKRPNGQFARVDTIHTQREGTSFAISDTDYGDKTCIISQGLGTISVSYKGQSFWVCCSGCKAAFDENPEKWIAKWEEKKKSGGK